jgi:hypothetical protein
VFFSSDVFEKYTMEEELSEMWGKFSLLEDEDTGVSLETSDLDPLVDRGKVFLIGKILADCIVPKEFFKGPLLRAWRTEGSVSFRVIGENLFIAEFEHAWEKARIMKGRPWLFDGNLVSLAEFDGITPPSKMNFNKESFWMRMYNLPLACMSREVGSKIGSSVGEVEDIDMMEDEAGWGEFLRVKVLMDLSKPIPRGRKLHLPNQTTWVAFKFERLPKFCFKCGVMRHGKTGCFRQGNRQYGKNEELPYGNWLRVSYPTRRRNIGPFQPEQGKHEGEVGPTQNSGDDGITSNHSLVKISPAGSSSGASKSAQNSRNNQAALQTRPEVENPEGQRWDRTFDVMKGGAGHTQSVHMENQEQTHTLRKVIDSASSEKISLDMQRKKADIMDGTEDFWGSPSLTRKAQPEGNNGIFGPRLKTPFSLSQFFLPFSPLSRAHSTDLARKNLDIFCPLKENLDARVKGQKMSNFFSGKVC